MPGRQWTWNKAERGLGALMAAALSTLTSATAWAQDPGIVEILPMGQVVGDGASVVTGHVWALDVREAPLVGAKLRVTTSAGEVSNVSEVGPGLYRFQLTAPLVAAAQNIQLQVKGKTADGEQISATASVPVSAAPPSKITLTANPPEIVLGQTTDATLTFQVEGPPGVYPADLDLVVLASSGEVSPVVAMGNGRFTARYTAPKVNYPHLALLTVADRRDPTRLYGGVAIPLLGKVEYPVQSVANATVLMRIGDREFGPVAANAQGSAKVPIVVQPGVSQATLISVVNGATTEESIDLRVPETRRVHLFPTPAGVPASSTEAIPVRALVLTADGKPDTTATVNITTTAGNTSIAKHEGSGIYVATLTPPDGRMQTTATVQVSLQGSTTQTASQEIQLVPGRPRRLDLSAEPSVLPAGANAARIFARVVGANEEGIPERTLGFRAVGAELRGGVQDMKGGDYRLDLATGTGAVTVHGWTQTAVSGNPLQHVVVLPAREVIAADGTTSTLVVVLTTDAWGYPVADVPVTLSVTAGGGQLPTTATTNAAGIAEVWYTAGRTPGLARLRAQARDYIGEAAIGLTTAGVELDLPTSGTTTHRAIADGWDAVFSSINLPREGATVAAANVAPTASAPVVDSVLPVSTLAIQLDRARVAPGDAVLITVRATDASGNGLRGKSIDFLTSAGRFGLVQDLGNGDYRITLNVPADATGTVKISALSADGPAALAQVQIEGAAATPAPADQPFAWGALPDANAQPTNAAPATPPANAADPAPTNGTTAATAEKPAKEPKEPKPKPAVVEIDRPWWRVRASGLYSTYRYAQRPSESPGPLIPQALEVGAAGRTPAAAPGFEVNARGFVEPLKYLGVTGTFRFSRYGIASSSFEQTITDNLYRGELSLIGRYPFEVGSSVIHVGARVGGAYDDFLTFRGNCLEPGCSVVYQSQGVGSLVLGAEVQAEIGHFYVMGAFQESLARGFARYNETVDVHVGYDIVKNFFVDAGFTGTFRNVTLQGADNTVRGTIEDSQLMGTLGVGVGF